MPTRIGAGAAPAASAEDARVGIPVEADEKGPPDALRGRPQVSRGADQELRDLLLAGRAAAQVEADDGASPRRDDQVHAPQQGERIAPAEALLARVDLDLRRDARALEERARAAARLATRPH